MKLTGVVTVESFTSETLRLKLVSGKLVISGSELKIGAFNRQSGILTAEGKIRSFKFGEKHRTLGSLFK